MQQRLHIAINLEIGTSPVSLFDTHCHIHEAVRRTTPVYDKWHEKGIVDPDEMLAAAREAGVDRLICVGTTYEDSRLAIEFVKDHLRMWASIGIHPHEAEEALQNGQLDAFAALATGHKVVAVGECGLDYFYNHSPKTAQLEVLRFQLALAQRHDLPVIFHVREAFDDFWPVFESYPGLRGVLHSYTDSAENLERALGHGLYIGINGIATFARNPDQLAMYKAVPLEKLVLETDAPFLTPTPYRGTINEPKYILVTATFVSKLRGENPEVLAAAATRNAQQLFGV